ncbi:hypothetical protein B0T13DRAFT_29472 [Neurospora crassa]|nr:hypothetical protein B0T13DRAFT_29472 [Neurospora crassa]
MHNSTAYATLFSGPTQLRICANTSPKVKLPLSVDFLSTYTRYPITCQRLSALFQQLTSSQPTRTNLSYHKKAPRERKILQPMGIFSVDIFYLYLSFLPIYLYLFLPLSTNPPSHSLVQSVLFSLAFKAHPFDGSSIRNSTVGSWPKRGYTEHGSATKTVIATLNQNSGRAETSTALANCADGDRHHHIDMSYQIQYAKRRIGPQATAPPHNHKNQKPKVFKP